MVQQTPNVHDDHTGEKRTTTGRQVVRGTRGMVCAGHYLTSMSAMRVLLNGGNAFDAAVAAGFTAAVVEPMASYSVATEGVFMVYQASTGELLTISGQGTAPGAATIDLLKSKGFDKMPTGPNAEYSFTLPGVVGAMLLMLETHGTKTLSEVLTPAIEYADTGFPMYELLHNRLSWRESREQFERYPPGGMDTFYPGGGSIQIGELLVQTALAGTLTKLADADAGASRGRIGGIQAARDMFYRGDIARTIVSCSEKVGGLITMEDLDGYQPEFDEPARASFQGYDVCAQSVWTQGPVLLQTLNMLAGYDLKGMGHNSSVYIHTVTEALKLAFADRDTYYGDPNFSSIPVEGLLSKVYGAERAKNIQAGLAHPELPPAGNPWPHQTGSGSGAAPSSPVLVAGGEELPGDGQDGTTHFAIIDSEGNMVAATPSGGVLARSVYFPELGCTLSTRSEMFVLDPSNPNCLEPGKRPRTTLVNYMVCKDGKPFMTIGCPGGDKQVQANLQLILNVLVFGMNPQEAVEAPRFSTLSIVNSFFPRTYLPGQLDVEPGIPEDVRSELSALGHRVVGVDTNGIGAVVTQKDPETGTLSAGADPRRATYAIAV